jgi:truncated hemoglobin YjbI
MIDDLYDLIGGRQTIWAATESFYRRVLADSKICHFFDSADMAHLRANRICRQGYYHRPRGGA